MARVIAYHVIFCNHGFWLPNDPRGSGSVEVRYGPLKEFGDANPVATRRSVAGKPHNPSLRKAAKQAMKLPEVRFTGLQAQSVANGFQEMIAKSRYVVHACAIMPQHTHVVIARHRYDIEQVGRLLRQAGTVRLLKDGLHPFAHLRNEVSRLPSVWSQDFRKVFLFRPEDIRGRIEYVNDNPLKDGLARQRWTFITPYNG